jgi:hypothetical protein
MIWVGLDLGQRQDFTALAVVTREEQRLAWIPARAGLDVVYLERMELGTPYTRVVERVCRIMQDSRMGEARVVVDATGVGAPVVDLLKASGLRTRLTAVTITGGESAHGSGEVWSVPRRDLLAGVEVLLESEELRIARGLRETPSLVRELEALRMDGGGSEHDDLVLAVGLACWRAGKSRSNGFGNRRLPGI